MRTAQQGARFLKTDEGSAFGGLANESAKTGPQGKEIGMLHNIFPLAYAKAPYEKFQEFNHMRGMNQTREGWAGIQRYPYIFAGDWPSEWQYFAPVIKAGLNIGISGVGNWAHCMGGFEHAADPELYIRWVQFGMFSPVALVFGMDHPGYKEPWSYGEDALRNFKKYDSLRYRLIPYIYQSAHNMHFSGMPIMRALVLDFQNDPNVYEIGDQYLFGESLMVCPVTTKGAQTRTVYLPEGEWYDYWTGKKYQGRQYIHVVSPLDTMPVFARAGSIIPMQPAMNYVDEKPVDLLTLDMYPGKETQLQYYEDDGVSLDYLKGKGMTYSEIKMSESGAELRVTINNQKINSRPVQYHYLARIHLPAKPSAVLENGAAVPVSAAIPGTQGWFYNETEQVLYVRTSGISDSNIQLNIRY
jgi:alpha-glucosidase